jgi:hypothetical protein
MMSIDDLTDQEHLEKEIMRTYLASYKPREEIGYNPHQELFDEKEFMRFYTCTK